MQRRAFMAATGLLLAAFLFQVGWTAITAETGFPASFGSLWRDPWFRVILTDLYLGFIPVAAWIGWREASPLKGLAWGLLLCVLGNVGTFAYLLWAAHNVPASALFVPRLVLGVHAPNGATQ